MKKLTFPILFVLLSAVLAFCQANDLITLENKKIVVVNDTLVYTTTNEGVKFLESREYMLWEVSGDTAKFLTPKKHLEYIDKSNN